MVLNVEPICNHRHRAELRHLPKRWGASLQLRAISVIFPATLAHVLPAGSATIR